jgi:hypothetical protein
VTFFVVSFCFVLAGQFVLTRLQKHKNKTFSSSSLILICFTSNSISEKETKRSEGLLSGIKTKLVNRGHFPLKVKQTKKTNQPKNTENSQRKKNKLDKYFKI